MDASLLTIRARAIPSERTVGRKTKNEVFAYPSEKVQQETWQLGTTVTDLVEALRVEVAAHDDFETWQQKAKLSDKALKDMWNDRRAQLPYKDLPERFARSAWLTTEGIYDSWFALKQSLKLRLDCLNRWLSIAKSDVELAHTCNCELESIKARADEILEAVKAEVETYQAEQTVDAESPVKTLTDVLFERYIEHKGNSLSQCAIAHIIKNDGRVAKRRENLGKFIEKFNKQTRQAERLEIQLAGSLPRGRDLTGAKFLQALKTATQQLPADDNEFQVWQASLLRKPKAVPYPLLFHSSTDLN